MNLESLVTLAASKQASDLHLEVGLKPTIRVRGELVAVGEGVERGVMNTMVRAVVGNHYWDEFQARRSFDRAMTIAGIRCRVNVLHSMRGVGMAIRILPSVVPTLDGLNLHPSLATLAAKTHGLVLISGPTGSGKSSTLAALLNEINTRSTRHILTIEHPIEYRLQPAQSFIRQREVGSDTVSFEQALLDALREDPDVIMVGEMREPECMRLTLNAAETGHLVLATLHSATVGEALQRIVLAFPAEIQGGIAAQLADCLVGVVCQRLTWREPPGLRVPECEVLLSNSASRSVIRQGEFVKLVSVMETGAADGMFTFDRYRRWVDGRTQWSRALTSIGGGGPDDPEPPHRHKSLPSTAARRQAPVSSEIQKDSVQPSSAAAEPVFEIDMDEDLNSLMDELKKR
jgi:twitching motility protein PilT